MTLAADPAGAPPADSGGGAIYRVDWMPGTDLLRGTCFCGGVVTADDPVRVWALLLAHPDHGLLTARL